MRSRASLAMVVLGYSCLGGASDHRDAPYVAERPSLDLTDLYVFPSPVDSTRLVVAVAANPFSVPGVTAFFSPLALYEFRFDQDGDGAEDLVAQVVFHGTGANQTVALRGPAAPRRPSTSPRPLLSAAAISGAVSETLEGDAMKLFAGLRDDPFFFDFKAFFGDGRLRDPGVDFYAGKNVSAIVLELPLASVAAPGKPVRVWATVSAAQSAAFVQQDRVGLPAINAVLIPPGSRDAHNRAEPRVDLAHRGVLLEQSLEGLGIPDPATRKALAAALLPDVLTYDPSKPAGFLNGRRLGDDVIDAVLGLLAGKGAAVATDAQGLPSDHVGGNDVPFANEFPYLAAPHEAR